MFMYKLAKPSRDTGNIESVFKIMENQGMCIPFNLDNSDYQVFLDDINEHGTSIVDDELPESILTAAAERKFQQQLNAYNQSVARLTQYLVSVGRPEVKEMVPIGRKVLNVETGEMQDVLVETITQTAIDPLPETIEITHGYPEPIKSTVRNPLIVQDEEQRAAAQAIIDATPQEVKDAA
jgi:hypothetical protein